MKTNLNKIKLIAFDLDDTLLTHKKVLTQENFNALKNAASVREASDVVLKNFERPANQSESVCEYRASLGENFYNEMHTV